MHKLHIKHQQVSFCELCNGDHPTGYCSPVNKDVNYMENQNEYQQRQAPYQNNSGYQQRGNKERPSKIEDI